MDISFNNEILRALDENRIHNKNADLREDINEAFENIDNTVNEFLKGKYECTYKIGDHEFLGEPKCKIELNLKREDIHHRVEFFIDRKDDIAKNYECIIKKEIVKKFEDSITVAFLQRNGDYFSKGELDVLVKDIILKNNVSMALLADRVLTLSDGQKIALKNMCAFVIDKRFQLNGEEKLL
jgi:hypothetical protein